MILGISGLPVPQTLLYAAPINAACTLLDFPPLLAYAIAWRESIGGEVSGEWTSAASVISADGGHGLFQLTSWYPDAWADPLTNARAAVAYWLRPDMVRWSVRWNLRDGDLVRATAASFNAGDSATIAGHDQYDDVDRFTTDHYGANVLRIYQQLILSGKPPSS